MKGAYTDVSNIMAMEKDQLEVFKAEREAMMGLKKSPLLFVQKILRAKPTWQQRLVLESIEVGEQRITIRSGHGTGKSTLLSWLMLWRLYTHPYCKILCTANKQDQLKDILWSEVKFWIKQMPKEIGEQYIWTAEKVGMKQDEKEWFAVARVAKKENPEALAGFHSPGLMLIADEASGICEEVFTTALGALTDDDALFIMTSNPTRNVGFFYDSHDPKNTRWRKFHFNSEQSPMVKQDFIDEIKELSEKKNDPDIYRVRVLGDFPISESIDKDGFFPLITTQQFEFVQRTTESPLLMKNIPKRMGVDPAGEGRDEASWVIRSNFAAYIVATEEKSSNTSIIQKTLGLMDIYEIPPEEVDFDSFNCGAEIVQLMVKMGYNVNGINVGNKATWEPENYINIRAEAYSNAIKWLLQGNAISTQEGWDELKSIYQIRTLSSKKQIMSKKEMRKRGYKSPNNTDALMLTFARGINIENNKINDIVSDEELRSVCSNLNSP